MLDSGKSKKNRKNPNDPARFIGKIAVTEEGEAADIQHYLDEKKISDEEASWRASVISSRLYSGINPCSCISAKFIAFSVSNNSPQVY